VRKQAERTKSVIDAALKEASGGKSPGDAITDAVNQDLKDGRSEIGRTAWSIGRSIRENIEAGIHGSGPIVAPRGDTGTGTHRQNQPEFDEGTMYVPRTGSATVHQPEIIVPAPDARAIRSGNAILGVPQAPDATGSAPPIVFNVQPASDRNAMLEALETARR